MNPGLSILTVALAYLAIAVIPGPNFLMTVRNTLTYSRTVGIFTAVGIGVGTALHGMAGLAGFFLIVLQTAWLYNVLKVGGGLYLVYVGVRTLVGTADQLDFQPEQSTHPVGKLRAIRHGILTSLSNPKTAVFFLSIFTTLIVPETPLWAKWTMALSMALTSVVWYSLVALSFSQVSVHHLYQRLSKPIRIVIGSIFIALGVRVATTQA